MEGSVLVVNAGSSSLKLRMLSGDDELLARSDLDLPEDAAPALADFVAGAGAPDAIGHRIVHGGPGFTRPVRLDDRAEATLRKLSRLAPLHNPPAIRLVEAAERLLPSARQVVCFDTTFHADLPMEARTYAVPADWSRRWDLRRFGFHGLSHAHAARRTAELLDRPIEELRIVTAHLGSGASLAAVLAGRSIDTTMGFTPLEGLVMSTRSGSVDPGLLLWVQREGGIDPGDAERALELESGLAGLSGGSGDMREVIAGAGRGDAGCELALSVYLHRLAGGIAAMTASLGGLDALTFTGGVGEHLPSIRERTCSRLGFLGLALDADTNAQAGSDTVVSAAGTTTQALVVESREDLEIARQVRAVLRDPP